MTMLRVSVLFGYSVLLCVVNSQSPPVFLGQSSPAVLPRRGSGPNPRFRNRQSSPIGMGPNPRTGPIAMRQQQGNGNMRSRAPNEMTQLQQSGQRQQQQQSMWAPGEPVRTFPGDRRVRTCRQRHENWHSDQRFEGLYCDSLCDNTSGCPRMGRHCVFWGGLCPSSIRGVPCRCERGCLVATVFIPFGQVRVMDACNNVCRCASREGQASCTSRRC